MHSTGSTIHTRILTRHSQNKGVIIYDLSEVYKTKVNLKDIISVFP